MCALHHVYRFIEPVVLFMLKEKGRSYGYDLTGEFGQHALTGTVIEKAALYRTLRCLEENGDVVSDWEVQPSGPARRVYALTNKGERHLEEWAKVLETVSQSMFRLVARIHSRESCEAEALTAGQPGPRKANEHKKALAR